MQQQWQRLRLLTGISVVRGMLLIGLLLMLPSCVISTVVDSYCLIAEPVFFSDVDSEETIRQITRENAKYDELCST